MAAEEDHEEAAKKHKKKERDKGQAKGPERGHKKAFTVAAMAGPAQAEDDPGTEDSEDSETASEERGNRRREARSRGRPRDREERIERKGEKARRKREAKEERQTGRKRAKKEVEKDRGPFGLAPTEEWDKDCASRGQESSSESSSGKSSFRKAPSSTSRHMKLVRYAKRRPGRLAARRLKKMEQSTGLGGGAQTKPLLKGNQVRPVAHMYFLAIMTPALQAKWTQRTQRELKIATSLLDLLVEGQGAEAADILAQRVKALEKSVHDNNLWRKAKHLELIEMDDAALVDQGEEDMMAKEADREDKTKRSAPWQEAEPWRKGKGKGTYNQDPRRKGSEGPKGKGKKGSPAERVANRDEGAAPP